LKANAAVPLIIKTLGDTNEMLRTYSAWALGRIGGIESKEALKQHMENEKDENVRKEIKKALEIIDNYQKP
jgi:epoxyqueuosine reductase